MPSANSSVLRSASGGPQVKIPVLACVLLCVFAAPESTKAQKLKGLHAACIVIESPDKETEDVGLTKESLTDQIVVALKRDIPKLKIESSSQRASLSCVYLEITSLETTTGIASFVSLSLRRPVAILEEDKGNIMTDPNYLNYLLAPVWNRGCLLIGGKVRHAARVRDQINQYLTALAAEYYKDNP